MTAPDRPQPRPPAQRKQDALRQLTTRAIDTWVASAGELGRAPHLVPLSLAWVDERVVLAVSAASRTARNITASGRARLGVGPTRDVVLLDVRLERVVPVADPAARDITTRYTAQADWDPSAEGGDYQYLVLRPQRIQAWREADELPGRMLMRNGRWLV